MIWKNLYKARVHHILFWVCYFAFWSYMYKDYYPTNLTLFLIVGIYLVFNALTFYGTSYYLIPTYLYKRKLTRFILFTILFFVVMSASLGLILVLAVAPYIPSSIPNIEISIFMGAFTTNVFFPATMCGAKLVVDRVRADRERKNIEQQRLESELQYLKAQVNPHFLFNAINSVYFLIKKDQDKAAETLIKLSDLLRFQLYDCSDEKIAIEKELEYLQNFISLEKIRKGEKIKVDFQTSGQLSGFTIAPFLLMPFLENAFKFVSNYADKPNTINIAIDRTDGMLRAFFYNTYDGVQHYTVGGIGLKNVRRRLELLYPQNHTLHIEEKPGEYSVGLTIPIT